MSRRATTPAEAPAPEPEAELGEWGEAELDAELAHAAEHQGDNAEPEPDPAAELDRIIDAALETLEPDEPDPNAETFPRNYVDKLRRQNAEHRKRAATAAEETDRLARALFTERVAALGLLADPADLAYDADALDSPDALRAAAEALLAARPHLRTRRITQRVGQGIPPAADTVSLAAILRQRA
jgi:hypothetical protein